MCLSNWHCICYALMHTSPNTIVALMSLCSETHSVTTTFVSQFTDHVVCSVCSKWYDDDADAAG